MSLLLIREKRLLQSLMLYSALGSIVSLLRELKKKLYQTSRWNLSILRHLYLKSNSTIYKKS
jgi:hypothetical protein